MLRPGLLLLTVTLTACSTVDSGALPETTNASQSGEDTGAPATTDEAAPTSSLSGPQSGTTSDESLSASATDTGPGGTGEDTGSTTGASALDYGMSGPYPVGNARFPLTVGDRELLVELWYPADASAAAEAATGRPIEDFVPAGPDHDALVQLLAELSPAGQIGTRLQTSSAFDAPPAADGPYPLIAFSHCHNCVRFSAFTVAERLASHGFLVVAPDHTGNTLFDQLGGDSADINEEFLAVRAADISAVLDAVLAAGDPIPEPLRGLADPDRVGALGHSYGAATTGRVAQDDPRIKAALPIAAPVENPVFPNTHVADIHVPMLMVLALEDNSIQKIGNNLIELNFMNANPPVRLVSVKDAGHWNFTDICGLVDGFSAGCGEGERQTEPGVQFTYLDIDVGREIASAYSLAFFDRYLRDNPAADDFLGAGTPPEFVTVEVRE